jgi:hypothetical protein
MFTGHYAKWVWGIGLWSPAEHNVGLCQSMPIHVGFTDPDGNIANPVVAADGETVEPILAYVFDKARQHELGFLFMNGSNEDVVIERPLTKASCILASAPAINYRRDLFAPEKAKEQVMIKSGKVGEWRLPRTTVLGLIPSADVEKIKAAGGDVDLVWKVGEYKSDPLPISLAPSDAE